MTNRLFYLAGITFARSIIKKFRNKKSQNLVTDFTDNLGTDYKLIEDNLNTQLQHILNEPDWFYVITDYLTNEKIAGIIQCHKISAVEEWCKKTQLINAGKTLVNVPGIRFRSKEDHNSYYLVMTDKNMHYFGYLEGKCLEHICFPLGSVMNLNLEDIAYREPFINEGRVLNATTKKLSFSVEEKNYNIIIYNFIIDSPFQYLVTLSDTRLWLDGLTKGFHTKLREILKQLLYAENTDF